MLKAIADEDHPDHSYVAEWLGDDYDAEAFDVDQVNAKLARRRARARSDEE